MALQVLRSTALPVKTRRLDPANQHRKLGTAAAERFSITNIHNACPLTCWTGLLVLELTLHAPTPLAKHVRWVPFESRSAYTILLGSGPFLFRRVLTHTNVPHVISSQLALVFAVLEDFSCLDPCRSEAPVCGKVLLAFLQRFSSGSWLVISGCRWIRATDIRGKSVSKKGNQDTSSQSQILASRGLGLVLSGLIWFVEQYREVGQSGQKYSRETYCTRLSQLQLFLRAFVR